MKRLTDSTLKFLTIASLALFSASAFASILLWEHNNAIAASLDSQKLKYEALLSEKLLLEKQLNKNKKRLEFIASDWIEHKHDPTGYTGIIDGDHYSEDEKRFIRYYDSLVTETRKTLLLNDTSALRTTTKIFTDTIHNLIRKGSLTTIDPEI